VSEAVHLGGLDAGATAELAAKVLGAARLPDELLRRLPSSTGGNPLFVREFIGMLAHDGVLVERPTDAVLLVANGAETLTFVLPQPVRIRDLSAADTLIDLALRVLPVVAAGAAPPPAEAG
jgi:predicted ATPase